MSGEWGGVLEANILLGCKLKLDCHTKVSSGPIMWVFPLLLVLRLYGEEVIVWKTVWVVV